MLGVFLGFAERKDKVPSHGVIKFADAWCIILNSTQNPFSCKPNTSTVPDSFIRENIDHPPDGFKEVPVIGIYHIILSKYRISVCLTEIVVINKVCMHHIIMHHVHE